MSPTLQIDDLHTLIDHQATRHILDAHDFGPAYGEVSAIVELYQLIPLQEHAEPWVLRVHQHDEDVETLEAFDCQREAEAAYAREVDRLTERYGDGDWDYEA